jgi:hypothetical protein
MRVDVSEIEGIIRAAILTEREFFSEVVAAVLGEALGRLDQEIRAKRDALASESPRASARHRKDQRALAEVRAIERERGKVVELPNPIRRVN